MNEPRNAIELFAQQDGYDWRTLRHPDHAELLAQYNKCAVCLILTKGGVCSRCKEMRW